MGRRRRGPASSLDLLLDTICNTFGGVVFIAILVTVLLQMTSSLQLAAPPDAPQHEQLVALETQRDDVDARLRSLREAAVQQEALLESIANPDDLSLAAQLETLHSRRDQLSNDRMNSLGQISQSQIKTNEVATRLASLDQALKNAPAKVAELEAELKQELSMRTEDARLPIQRDTDKREIPFLLTGGRLRSVYLVHDDGSIVFNSGECAIGNSSGGEEVTAKPGTGLVIDESDPSRNALQQRLANLDRDADYLAVFVWPDAFQQFRLLKEVLVSKNFEYRLVPMTADQKVYRGGAAAKPKVQ